MTFTPESGPFIEHEGEVVPSYENKENRPIVHRSHKDGIPDHDFGSGQTIRREEAPKFRYGSAAVATQLQMGDTISDAGTAEPVDDIAPVAPSLPTKVESTFYPDEEGLAIGRAGIASARAKLAQITPPSYFKQK